MQYGGCLGDTKFTGCSGREDTGNKIIAGLSGCLLGALCQVLSGDHLVLREHYEEVLLEFPVCR